MCVARCWPQAARARALGTSRTSGALRQIRPAACYTHLETGLGTPTDSDSEVPLHRELDDARRHERIRDGTEAAGCGQHVRVDEVHGIEQIEDLEAHLEPLLRDRETLEDAQVYLEVTGTGKQIPCRACGSRRRRLEQR